MRINSAIVFSAVCFMFVPALQAQSKKDPGSVHVRLSQEVRRELIMLDNYSVFDNLEFRVSGVDTVTLSGQVTRPTLKSDAESAVRSIEAVGKIVNDIEVLPVSPGDEKIRVAAFRAVFSKPPLERYGYRAVPPIHIIVNNGAITLVGVVATQAEKDIAGLAAREAPGTFSVTNNLKVESR
jgi:hyperosmotically inducible periplasmic protein